MLTQGGYTYGDDGIVSMKPKVEQDRKSCHDEKRKAQLHGTERLDILLLSCT